MTTPNHRSLAIVAPLLSQNRNVGSDIMKTIAIVILVMLVGYGCGRRERGAEGNTDVVVWISQTEGGPRYDIAHMPLSELELSNLLRHVSKTAPGFLLIIKTEPRVAITNTFPVLSFAEACEITNIELRLNQTRPPPNTDGVRADKME